MSAVTVAEERVVHDDPPPARRSRLDPLSIPAWLVAGLVTGIVCLVRAGSPVPWRDELATLIAAQRSFSEQLHMEHNLDAVFAVYYAFMHVWTELFGISMLSLRLPSVLAMAVAGGLVARIGQDLYDRKTGLFAGLIFASIPAVTRYGQEIRVYAAVVAFTLLSSWLLLRAVRQPRWTRWIAYAVSVVLVGAGHIFALTVLSAHAAYVLFGFFAERKRPLLTWIRQSRVPAWTASVAAGIVVIAPLAYVSTKQSGQVAWIPELNWDTGQVWHEQLFMDGAVGGLVVVLALLAVNRKWSATALCLGIAVLPLLVLAIMSLAVSPLWMMRYVLFTIPGWALLAGAALARLNRVPVTAALAALALFSLPQQITLRGVNGHDDIDHQAIAAIIADHVIPGDAIMYTPRGRFREGVEYYLPADKRPDDILVAGSAVEAGRLEVPECINAPSCVDPRVARIWVTCYGDCLDNPAVGLHMPARSMLKNGRFHVKQSWRVYRATVTLYQR
ncbi:glycosyltransferase family 39 protein [Actinoplanes sp. CA-015351]|uniref:glycosyltransferase family 39 protein n=1 Tax=Actinoplanes sp. CA-015351 TaxID=3239897 RepID=UPI003D9969FC